MEFTAILMVQDEMIPEFGDDLWHNDIICVPRQHLDSKHAILTQVVLNKAAQVTVVQLTASHPLTDPQIFFHVGCPADWEEWAYPETKAEYINQSQHDQPEPYEDEDLLIEQIDW